MIFLVLAVVVLVVSFVIALTSLIREQKKLESEVERDVDTAQTDKNLQGTKDEATYDSIPDQKSQGDSGLVRKFQDTLPQKAPQITQTVPYPWEEASALQLGDYDKTSKVIKVVEEEKDASLPELNKTLNDSKSQPEGSFYIRDILKKD